MTIASEETTTTAEAPFSEQTIESLAAVLHVLADPTRIRLIETLERRGRSTVSALTACLPISQQSVSHQLGVLRGAGMVTRRREGSWVHYELADWTGPWLLHQLADGLQGDPDPASSAAVGSFVGPAMAAGAQTYQRP